MTLGGGTAPTHAHGSRGPKNSMTIACSMTSQVAVHWGLIALIGPLGTLTVHQIDLRAQEEDLVCQALGSGQHLGVVRADEVLHELLQLVPVHLGECLRNGQPQLYLAGMSNSV